MDLKGGKETLAEVKGKLNDCVNRIASCLFARTEQQKYAQTGQASSPPRIILSATVMTQSVVPKQTKRTLSLDGRTPTLRPKPQALGANTNEPGWERAFFETHESVYPTQQTALSHRDQCPPVWIGGSFLCSDLETSTAKPDGLWLSKSKGPRL